MLIVLDVMYNFFKTHNTTFEYVYILELCLNPKNSNILMQ